ncbi:MAG: GNAT family N-acetyltransferase [Burkholderiales bacterium]|nr:GNAT family N-acetyltransferase [Burkholderiales bacterium]
MRTPSETILRGEFVDLRPLIGEDAGLTFSWRQGVRATLLNKGAETVEQQARWIASRPANEYNFIIALKNGRAIGMLSLCGLDRVNRHAEPGRFLIGDEAAAQGVPAAAEAMLMLYELAFDELDLHRVHGTVASDNTRMIKWQLFMGMKQEGRLRDHYFINGHFQDAVCFGLLAADYQRVAKPRLKAMVAAGHQRIAQISQAE